MLWDCATVMGKRKRCTIVGIVNLDFRFNYNYYILCSKGYHHIVSLTFQDDRLAEADVTPNMIR